MAWAAIVGAVATVASAYIGGKSSKKAASKAQKAASEQEKAAEKQYQAEKLRAETDLKIAQLQAEAAKTSAATQTQSPLSGNLPYFLVGGIALLVAVTTRKR